jgi:hypothetical protein
MQKAGFSFTSTNAASIALSSCDTLHILQVGADDAGKSITLQTVQHALDALGDAFVPAGLQALRLTPAKHDGAVMAYDLQWDSSCSCSKYVSGGFRVS